IAQIYDRTPGRYRRSEMAGQLAGTTGEYPHIDCASPGRDRAQKAAAAREPPEAALASGSSCRPALPLPGEERAGRWRCCETDTSPQSRELRARTSNASLPRHRETAGTAARSQRAAADLAAIYRG